MGLLWTAVEDAMLRRMAPYRTNAEMASVLDRTEKAVASRRRKTMGRRPSWGARWTAADVACVRRRWAAGDSALKIAAALPGERNRNMVIGLVARLGLLRKNMRLLHVDANLDASACTAR